MAGLLPIIKSKAKEREKAIEEMVELLKVYEDGIKKDLPEKFSFVKCEALTLLGLCYLT